MQRKYKTYRNLKWGKHHLAIDAKKLDPHQFPMLAENRLAKHARMFFDNGYGISVIKDAPLITGFSNFECAVIRGTADGYELDYKTGIADDVIRTDSVARITRIMRRIQNLPPANQKDAA